MEKVSRWETSPNVGRVIKSRKLRWTDHIGSMEEDRNALNILKEYTYRKETFKEA